jgi:hypothetical protein
MQLAFISVAKGQQGGCAVYSEEDGQGSKQ